MIQTVTVEVLKAKMDTQPDLCLIDVREIAEWNESRIPRAIHIPKDEMSVQIESHIPDKTKPIYLHCRGGVRSMTAAQCLMDMGYSDVYSVEGGISAWAASDYPIET